MVNVKNNNLSCLSVGSCTVWCRCCSRWQCWGIWRSWLAGCEFPSSTCWAASLATWPQPFSCPTEPRWVPQEVSSASWPVCLWSYFRAGRSSSGRGGLLQSCWPSQSSSSPLVYYLGLTTLPTSVVLYQDSSSLLPSCRTSASGVLICTGRGSRSVCFCWSFWVCSPPWPSSSMSTLWSVTGASTSPASLSQTSSVRSTTWTHTSSEHRPLKFQLGCFWVCTTIGLVTTFLNVRSWWRWKLNMELQCKLWLSKNFWNNISGFFVDLWISHIFCLYCLERYNNPTMKPLGYAWKPSGIWHKIFTHMGTKLKVRKSVKLTEKD